MILDPELMEGAAEKDDFLNVFYDHYMERLVACITSGQAVKDKMRGFEASQVDSADALVAHTQNQVCEILAFCVQSHGYRIKYFILRHNIVQKALGLVHPTAKASHLTMAVIRFVRACVGLKDEFYNRHMVKNNLFESVMATFVANGAKYNLLNSAVIEMIDFIRRENIKTLVKHIVETYRDQFSSVTYVETFTDLIVRYDQNTEGERAEEGGTAGKNSPPRQQRRRAVESEDEAYFNESDDETPGEQAAAGEGGDTPVTNGSALGGLAAYGDEEEGASPPEVGSPRGPAGGDNPPPKRQKMDDAS
jgi:protein phosphatase-4 regulatory subunit 3